MCSFVLLEVIETSVVGLEGLVRPSGRRKHFITYKFHEFIEVWTFSALVHHLRLPALEIIPFIQSISLRRGARIRTRFAQFWRPAAYLPAAHPYYLITCFLFNIPILIFLLSSSERFLPFKELDILVFVSSVC